ncbi:protein kinase domain containing protein [Stylonychia lemnae]|uniref:Protein kinase domain containing protein n=1 Tax=Stylonychia lemnae TaxID=5949 RepID=A0A078ARI5_STYLE|nr:protein kinase domain containing protein [Stylonychia lemnae]|eukprot:CDW85075.1 protein kinase domain containing protein [Stylonychia lemnae]
MKKNNNRTSQQILEEKLVFEDLAGIEGIIKYFGMVNQSQNSDDRKAATVPSLYLEYCQYGSLQQLQMYTIPFTETLAFVVMRQLLFTIQEIHKRGYVHLDLKEANILLNFKKENQTSPLNALLPIAFKISDLGISKKIEVIRQGKVNCKSGTIKYMSPEQHNSPNRKFLQPEKIDIFALGVILFNLVFKKLPFATNSGKDPQYQEKPKTFVKEFMEDYTKNTYKVQISASLSDLLQRMLSLNPKDRPGIDQIQQSNFFQEQTRMLLNDREKALQTKQQLFNKLQYVVNLTKIRIPLKPKQEVKPNISVSISTAANSLPLDLQQSNINVKNNDQTSLKQCPVLMEQKISEVPRSQDQTYTQLEIKQVFVQQNLNKNDDVLMDDNSNYQDICLSEKTVLRVNSSQPQDNQPAKGLKNMIVNAFSIVELNTKISTLKFQMTQSNIKRGIVLANRTPIIASL